MTPHHNQFRKTIHIAIAALALAGVTLAASSADRQQMTLKDRIEYGLETSKVTKKYYIEVKVEGDDATLSGMVASNDQREEAARLATVAGAKKVNNSIVIDKYVDTKVADRLKAGLTKKGEKITDDWIELRMKWLYTLDDLTKDSSIDVDADKGVVTLKGKVKSQAGRTRAVALAEDTEGVRQVVDKLEIDR